MTDWVQPEATVGQRTAVDAVSVKGFGDFVIALTCLRHVVPERRHMLRLVIGRHLDQLCAVLAPPFDTVVLPRREDGPAVLFQARTRPIREVARSAFDLRRALRATGDRQRTLLFDEWDIRHRFLGFGVPASALPRRDNLYRSWNDFLVAQQLAVPVTVQPALPHGRKLHIFPGARENERRLPVPFLHGLVERAVTAGLTPTIFTVAGEMPHLADASLPLREMPRSFDATVAAISSADRVVSADSMTAHLAEYFGKPVFVVSPTLKYYWLPLSSAVSERHALFAGGPGEPGLSAFLQQDRP